MSTPDLAQRAAAELSRVLEAPSGRPRTLSERDRAVAISALEMALRRRGRRPLLAGGALAGALCVVAAVALLPGRTCRRRPAPSDLAPPVTLGEEAPADLREVRRLGGGELKPGDVVVSRRRNGPTVLMTSRGTRLSLAEDGELAVVETGRTSRFLLTRGRVHAEVVPMGPGERFVIQTLTVEVEVHGTVFDVIVVPRDGSCKSGTTTRVVVARGVVAVGSAGSWEEVRQGEHWPAACPVAAVPAASPVRAHPTRGTDRRATPGDRASDPTAGSHGSSADQGADVATPIAEQNNLLATALAHKQRGRLPQALGDVETLLRRWPGGPFVESAMAERMRILHGLCDGCSRDAALDYLRRFPEGFAREEANRVVQGGR